MGVFFGDIILESRVVALDAESEDVKYGLTIVVEGAPRKGTTFRDITLQPQLRQLAARDASSTTYGIYNPKIFA